MSVKVIYEDSDHNSELLFSIADRLAVKHISHEECSKRIQEIVSDSLNKAFNAGRDYQKNLK